LIQIEKKNQVSAPIEIVRHDTIKGRKKFVDTVIYKRDIKQWATA